ncbi:MAG TPA: acyl-CoA desaturase [Chitinophagaceae bacterium]|nr:acyl-CoA desaturase [Chitinophagaceae bacterium]
MSNPKFIRGKGEFHVELKKRVNQYFLDHKKPVTGTHALFLKAIILCLGYVAIYIHLVFFMPVAWIAIPECVLFGCLTAAIGFNVMHDGAHGSFSKFKIVNKMAGFSLNFLGGSSIMWNMKHNIIHHTYTNIDGIDDDIEARPWLRFTASQKKLKLHRFQHYYFWFLYALLHFMWSFVSDYKKYFSGKIGPVPLRKMTVREHISFWAAKMAYAFMLIALPIELLGFVPWLVGFLIITMVTGFVISIIFQLAHTVEPTSFPLPGGEGKIENEWAIHQIETTANFATKNKVISWLIGGLNFQIEHHLFPKISHVHYPAISKITKTTCAEFGLVYIEFPKMSHAVISHVAYLKRLSRVN